MSRPGKLNLCLRLMLGKPMTSQESRRARMQIAAKGARSVVRHLHKPEQRMVMDEYRAVVEKFYATNA